MGVKFLLVRAHFAKILFRSLVSLSFCFLLSFFPRTHRQSHNETHTHTHTVASAQPFLFKIIELLGARLGLDVGSSSSHTVSVVGIELF